MNNRNRRHNRGSGVTFVQINGDASKRMCRSMDSVLLSQSDPYQLLAAAIIYQAAVDCKNYRIEIDNVSVERANNGHKFCTGVQLRRFINSDWLEELLSWQNEITVEGMREELLRRLETQ